MIETNVCPKRLVPQYAWELLRLHAFFEKGVLPFAGGLYDQPAMFVDAMAVIDDQKSQS
ncbi:MAG: hypothetical protein ACU85V_00070 [Gammaproteobacteria bacterium]